MQMSESLAVHTIRVCGVVPALRIHRGRGVVSCVSLLPARTLALAQRRPPGSRLARVDRCAGRVTPITLPPFRESVGYRYWGAVSCRDVDDLVESLAQACASASCHAARLLLPGFQSSRCKLSHKSSKVASPRIFYLFLAQLNDLCAVGFRAITRTCFAQKPRRYIPVLAVVRNHRDRFLVVASDYPNRGGRPSG